ncbi:MAG: ROK family transcriptional regulator [Candidatus Accumulibacter sp.]|nr:ROK family transcriptional regulator [Accumulibacter sp.]
MRAIFASERISQRELADKLRLSWPTVLQNVKELQAQGLVEEVGEFESTGGRKARAFASIRDARLAVGLSVTQNHIGIVLVDLSGELVRYVREKKVFSYQDSYFESLKPLVTDFVAKAGYPDEKILGAGISLPGIVEESGQTLAHSHVLGLHNVPTDTISRHIPYPCQFINDANAAGLAELWGKPQRRNTVYLSLSNSVGGAIFHGRAIYMGDNRRAGEFGHNTLVPDGKPCYCGKQGCVDAYCSSNVLSSHTDGNIALFFEGLSNGDAALRSIWDEYLGWLAIAVNNLRMSFDCDVIIGGYVGGYFDAFSGELRARLEARNTFEPDASYLKGCRYKLEAAAMGAALGQIEAFIQQL